jgi:hypothetical protein
MENEFPPNDHASRRKAQPGGEAAVKEKAEVRQIARSKVTRRKKPLHRKFIEAFRPEDGSGFVEYTLLEVLVPGIKDAVADAATNTIEAALGVDRPRSHRRRHGGGGGYTSYNRMSSGRPRGRRDRDRDDRDDDRRSRRSARRDDEFIVGSRVEAEEILETMIEVIGKYDVVTKRELLSMLGEPHTFADEDWGWTDLRGSRIHRVGRDYLLDLPRIEELD